VTLKNVVCNGDPMFVSDIGCRIFAGNRTYKRLTITANIMKDQNNILVSFSIKRKEQDGLY
jgi:hypothetical protein